MINKIAHLADIHIRKTPTRNDEYSIVFKNLYKSLKKEKPDRIVIPGDLLNDYIDLQGEQLMLAGDFLTELSKIAPVIVTRGNHDIRKKNLNRVAPIKAIISTLKNPNIIYYDSTDVFYDENVAWFVWNHAEKNNNPWKKKEGKIYESLRTNNEYISIDLFHDPINGCKAMTGLEMNSRTYYSINDFKGDLSFFGDIHKQQFFANGTKAYSGSLIAQDISEGDDNFHGYLLWDLTTKTAKPIQISSDYSYKNINISPYVDFDDLDFEINNPTKVMKVRFIWNTLPQTRTKDNERKLSAYVKQKYPNASIVFLHKNQFLETDKIDIQENVTLQNITEPTVQHEIFRTFLEKIGVDEKTIDDVIQLDEEILKYVDIDSNDGIEWNVLKFGGKNFASYGELDIDWQDLDGLFQITGMNTAGKTTLMKLISYVLFGNTLETESRVKYGDKRFINNRNGANFTENYVILEANGEYYGIKRRTDVNRSKDGIITGAPTTVNYYQLTSPNDELNENTSIETLDGERRDATQKKINAIIGKYDNFKRIVITTSDTLNDILSNNMAEFIDSLLFDSGLDIFDKKLEGFKLHVKKLNEKPRITCNVEQTKESNVVLKTEIDNLDNEIKNNETIVLPDIQSRIKVGKDYIETLTKKLFKIDTEISNLNVTTTNESIETHRKQIKEYENRMAVINKTILPLKESYDNVRLDELLVKKETHKTNEYTFRLKIKDIKSASDTVDHENEIIRGTIKRLMSDGLKKKTEILELRESKTCPTCGQQMTAEHLEHVNKKISEIEKEMFQIAEDIKKEQKTIDDVNIPKINAYAEEVKTIEANIVSKSLEMEDVLHEIGNLTNDKNDVSKRKELQVELDQIPVKIENENLKINTLQTKLDNRENSLKQIEENLKIESGIKTAKTRLELLEIEEVDCRENILTLKTRTAEKQLKIKVNEELISNYLLQERQDNILALYKKCVHRDGIPTQMLSNYIIPKINLTLENILSIASFKVWLDVDDMKPKLAYNIRPDSIIDCIGASGKERTFSSIVLKFALNQINSKSKPSIFMLDEVMGKLDDESVGEFIEILKLIKSQMKKTLIVEHNHEISPDYLLEVTLDEDGISSVTLT